MGHMANLKRKMGDHSGALALRQSVLVMQREKLGDTHPHTLQSLSTTALVKQEMGDHAGALALDVASLMEPGRAPTHLHPHSICLFGWLCHKPVLPGVFLCFLSFLFLTTKPTLSPSSLLGFLHSHPPTVSPLLRILEGHTEVEFRGKFTSEKKMLVGEVFFITLARKIPLAQHFS